jgi:protein tyrosine/serine phosphatase
MSQTTTDSHETRGGRPRPLKRIGFLVVGLALLGGGGAALWKGVLEPRFVAKRFGVVVPGRIFRSGQISKWMIDETLTEHKIKAIVNLAGFNPDDPNQVAEREAARTHGIEVLSYGLKGDGTGDIRSYAQALQAVVRCEQEGKPVLVHCSAGAQRTGGVVSLYRVLIQGQSMDETLAQMRTYGWNPQRDRVLLVYLNEHMSELTQLLVENGTLAKVPEPLPNFRL